MTQEMNFDIGKTAVLIMDYQNRQLYSQPENKRSELLDNAKKILFACRNKRVPIIHVEVLLRQGPPNFKPWEEDRRRSSGQEELGKREKIYEIHPEVLPNENEIVFTKRRIGPFSTTNLAGALTDLGVEHLVLLGISTGGVVLSVVRWAADIDYQIIVLKDACADPDEEVHRVLMEKVFPRQASVIACEEFLHIL